MPKFVKIILIILGLFTIALYLKNPPKTKTAKDNFFIGSKNVFTKTFTPEDNLQDLINKEAQAKEATWAIAIKNLKNNKTYFWNENQSISSASLYKLAVMWAVFDQINQASMTFDQPIGNTNVQNALNAMITVSDNEAAIALAETIGWGKIDNIMTNEGLTGFDLAQEDPHVTAKSASELLERIYRDTAVSKEHSNQMENLLLSQQINDRIPKYLPKNVKVAHKTGELDFVRHDAGIVYGKKADYIFVFLTDTQHPGNTPEEIAQFSKKIYDELEK
ncbi:hypothetical protein A2870_01795 [Candidatus Curtissbacteria bacterium RIFCSPHIGHO2_01_FULL_41_11]|uniref:Beta-lactamase class A catalytic domain-containing protein n=1 Tax=Candidatus Curtissbacteria bacterium RIFCSPHIGHO2_01_FULL_41_11 TaxID=1797711 RepID=A0A1F5G5D3_9BACT|nr:MAG: hypothetical protein A2870_01795 [Candidatus Curtissbacteria bacterium RIFCSPHIGHO2_01_FULL_41_11]